MIRAAVRGRVRLFGAILLLLAGGIAPVAAETDHENQILRLAREGRNREAIEWFEQLPGLDQVPTAVLRAAAGCYWRERRFHEARELYRRILEQQPNLNPVAGVTSPPVLLAREHASDGAGGEPVLPPLRQELESLKGAYEDLKTEREQLANEAERLRAEAQSLSGNLDAARVEQNALAAENEQRIHDLLDAVEQERRRYRELETKFGEARDQLVVQSEAAAIEQVELENRLETLATEHAAEMAASAARADALEQERLSQMDALRAAATASAERVTALERQLQDSLARQDEISARLAEHAEKADRRENTILQRTLEMALAEIERLEREYAELASDRHKRLEAMQERIAQVEHDAETTAATLADMRRERDEEHRQRIALEENHARQGEELHRVTALLAEATSALSRQYDAIRQQVDGEPVMRLQEGDPAAGAAESGTLPDTHPDELAPLIDRLEAAMASATAEVHRLRRQLEQERVAFAASAEETERERQALVEQSAKLGREIEEIRSSAAARDGERESEHLADMERLKDAHEARVAELEKQVEKIRSDLAFRDRAMEWLETDLADERESAERVLQVALQSGQAMEARVRELEEALAKAVTNAMLTNPARWEETAGEIEALCDQDPASAIERFELFPLDSPWPGELLKTMGDLYRDQGRFASALRVYEHMQERDPADLHAARKVVMTLFDMGLYDEALDRLAGPAPEPR